MSRTNFTVSCNEADADHARPYVRGVGQELRAVPYAGLELGGPAGNINSCTSELVPWLLTLLGQGADGRSPLLSAQVLDDLRTPTMPLPAASPGTGGTRVGYGLGLFLEDYRGVRVAHHGGNIDGFSSMLLHAPEAGIGIAVLTNLNATPLRDVIPYVVLDELLGLAPRPHGETAKARLDAVQHGSQQAEARRTGRSSALPAVRPLGDYAGTYEHPGYGTFTVAWDGSTLTAAYSGLAAAPLQHRQLEVFELVVELGGEELRVPVQFTHDLDGEVDGLGAVLEAEVAPQRFVRQPDTAHLDDALLDQLAGTYALGPITAVVTRRGAQDLVVSVMGGAPAALVPVRELTFRLNGSTVEFAGDGRLLTDLGELRRSAT